MAASDQLQSKKDTDDQATAVVTDALLIKDLKPISAKWEEFGLQVGIPLEQLEKIRNNSSGRTALVDYCFNRVIDAWLKGNRENITKEFLVNAIKAVGGHANLVPKVESMKFKKNPTAGPFIQLLQEMKSKYSQLGVQLGVSLAKVKDFETLAGNADNCLILTISYWLNKMADVDKEEEDDDDDEESNKEILFEALKTVGFTNLAQELEEKYRDMEFPGDEKVKAVNIT